MNNIFKKCEFCMWRDLISKECIKKIEDYPCVYFDEIENIFQFKVIIEDNSVTLYCKNENIVIKYFKFIKEEKSIKIMAYDIDKINNRVDIQISSREGKLFDAINDFRNSFANEVGCISGIGDIFVILRDNSHLVLSLIDKCSDDTNLVTVYIDENSKNYICLENLYNNLFEIYSNKSYKLKK